MATELLLTRTGERLRPAYLANLKLPKNDTINRFPSRPDFTLKPDDLAVPIFFQKKYVSMLHEEDFRLVPFPDFSDPNNQDLKLAAVNFFKYLFRPNGPNRKYLLAHTIDSSETIEPWMIYNSTHPQAHYFLICHQFDYQQPAVGFVRINSNYLGHADIGLVVDNDYWRRKIGSWASWWIVVLAQYLGYAELTWTAHQDNAASRRLAESLEFINLGERRSDPTLTPDYSEHNNRNQIVYLKKV